jgi:peptidoglycan/xylan/chitin deacetylase (PgdA/CDA1 family)
LTFDDGYQSMREVALPVLREFAYPGVLFVPTEYIGGHNSFDADEEPLEPMCDWDDLRYLERYGVSIQSHSVAHRAFSQLNIQQQQRELDESKGILESGLQKEVQIFSFPYGDDGGRRTIVAGLLRRARYRAACLYDGELNDLPIGNPFQLHRLTLGPDSDLDALLTPVEASPP